MYIRFLSQQWIQIVDLEWSLCPFECFKAADVISHGYVAIWKSKVAHTLKTVMHVKSVLVTE